MASTKQLPADVLSVVADQIGVRIEPKQGDTDGHTHFMTLDGGPLVDDKLNVGESFEAWRLVPDAIDAIAEGERNIDKLARRSGFWHHQIRKDKKPLGFARSKPLGPDASSWSVRDIFMSELASEIDEAIAKVDAAGIPDEIEVRLLSIPGQQVEAFWFVSDNSKGAKDWVNKLMIIRSPTRIPQFEFLKVLDAPDFLAALVTENRGMGVR
jgi:hypothetical protein